MKKSFRLNIVWVLISFMPAAFADTGSSVRYEQARYDNDADSYYLDVDLGLESKNHFMLGYSKNSSVVGSETLDSDLFYVGMQTDPYADMSTGVTYTSLKDQNNFDIASIRLDLIFNTDDWAFSLSPELRNIDIYTTTGSTINTFGSALGVSASYYGIDNVFMSVGRIMYSYDKNISSSSGHSFSGMGMFTYPTTTQDQAYGLEDYRNSISAGYSYGAGTIGFRHTRIVAVYDAAVTTINRLYVSYNINESWRAELSTGRVDDSVTDNQFVGAALGYYW